MSRKKNKPWPQLHVRDMQVIKHWWEYVPGRAPKDERATMPGHEFTHLDDIGRLERAIASRRRMHVGPWGHQKIRFRWWLDDHRRRATLFLRAVVVDLKKIDEPWGTV